MPKTPPEANAETDELATARLEISRLRKEINEERFAWCLVIIIAVDILYLPNIKSTVGIIGVLVFQALLLVILGRRWGIDDVERWVNLVVGKASRK
jgi:hypothetical protein